MKLKVVLIILYDSQKKFLLQHRSNDAKLLPGYWAFFGGAIQNGESPEEAVRRESFEELNYSTKSPHLVIEQHFQEGNTNGYMYVYIEAYCVDKSALKLEEGQDWGWYNESEMGDLRMNKRDRNLIQFISDYLSKKNEFSREKT